MVSNADVTAQPVKSTTASLRLIQRGRIILLSYERLRNDEIATQVGLNRKQVGLWRRRWKQSFDALVLIECREPQATLRRTIGDVLSDAPRAGTHGKFSAEQMTQIMAVACESPEIEQGKDFIQLKNCPFDLDLIFAPDGIESFQDAWR